MRFSWKRRGPDKLLDLITALELWASVFPLDLISRGHISLDYADLLSLLEIFE
jgi:hypothetical protein